MRICSKPVSRDCIRAVPRSPTIRHPLLHPSLAETLRAKPADRR